MQKEYTYIESDFNDIKADLMRLNNMVVDILRQCDIDDKAMLEMIASYTFKFADLFRDIQCRATITEPLQ